MDKQKGQVVGLAACPFLL
ncbi:Protein of unknown function [Bacillus mycoides]|nr:Protein of unknown function [Bacillus mycoides]